VEAGAEQDAAAKLPADADAGKKAAAKALEDAGKETAAEPDGNASDAGPSVRTEGSWHHCF
jgi:formiminotetrahydrofolate cyclodeaminase